MHALVIISNLINRKHAIFFQNTKWMFSILLRLLSTYVLWSRISVNRRQVVSRSPVLPEKQSTSHVLWPLFVSFSTYIGRTNKAIIRLASVSCFFEPCTNTVSKHPIEIKQGLVPGTYTLSGDNVKIDGDSVPIRVKY